MSRLNRADRRREAREKQAQERKELRSFLRATKSDAYFKAKCEAHERLSVNGITPADLQESYERGRKDGSREAFDSIGTIYTCAMIYTLNTLHGFGAKRLVAIMDHMNEFMTEKLTSQEAMQAVYDKVGLNFFKDDPFHPLQLKE